MSHRQRQPGDGTPTHGARGRLLVTAVVVFALGLSIPVAYVSAGGGPSATHHAQVAGPSGQAAPADYSVQQAENCTEVVPVTSDEPVREFYDYRTPFPDNNYTNATGTSYSSEGTTEYQEANGSVLLLHQNATGTLSLVAVHGSLNETSQGGSASFNVTGLPAEGTWAVKDDEYDHPSRYDEWSHEDGTATIDWTWNASRTDGFAFAGLGEAFDVTIEPAFNENATLYQEYYDGTVENWTVVSNESTETAFGDADESVERTELSLTGNVTVSDRSCDDVAEEGGPGITPDPAPTPDDDTDTETDEPPTETAEPDTETEAPATDTEEPDTESESDETETEEPDTETELPETEEPNTETEEPETETELPETEEPNTETEEPETETELPATEDPDTETEEPEIETEGPATEESDTEIEEPETEAEGPDTETETAATDGRFPTVDAAVWDRNGASEEFFVEWVVSDDDGDLSQVSVELLQDNSVIATQSQTVSGPNAISTTRMSGEGADAVQVIVTDQNGNQDDLRYEIGPPTPGDGDGVGDAGQ